MSHKHHIEKMVNPKRVFALNDLPYKKGTIVYWMQREQRSNHNWALLYAQELAVEHNQPLLVVHNIFDNCNIRKLDFMIKGLKKLEKAFSQKNIPFCVLQGQAQDNILNFINKHNAGALVTDFNPLKFKLQAEDKVAKNLSIPFFRVDAHNICPVMEVSNKKEYAARTIRPKINRALVEFLTDFPQLLTMPKIKIIQNNWDDISKELRVDKTIKPVKWIKSGEDEAFKVLDSFIENRLEYFAEKRNNPNEDACSGLSPYLHFGQISAQQVALSVVNSKASSENKDAFLEELIIRKELADNYCYYNKNYDSVDGFDNWAKATLEEHKEDLREYLYTKEEFENARTHDELWNAAQRQMVNTGKMHGYLRMYWAKKILEWSFSYEEAFDTAIYLNDKYELDGCDPNGYVGVAWSIGGVHDRAWGQRDIFGKIRYMSFRGCKNKFDVDSFIKCYNQ